MSEMSRFHRDQAIREIRARRRDINRTMIYNHEVGKKEDASLVAELGLLAEREDALLGFRRVARSLPLAA